MTGDGHRAIRQLDAMIANLTTFATPVLRDIASRAAKLAGKAGEAAEPVAHNAAATTEQVGDRLAAKGHQIASGMRSGRAGPPSGRSVRPDESTNHDGPPSP